MMRAMQIALSYAKESAIKWQANDRHPPGPPMDLANMRGQGVRAGDE